MVNSNQVEVEFIAFHTRDDISAKNVVRLISSVESLYDVFYSKSVAERLHEDAIHALMHSVEELDHPMWHEFGMVWRDYLHVMRKRAYKGAPLLLPPFPGMPTLEQQLTPPSEIFRSLDAYRDQSDQLIIDRIRISSPGGFSFKGIGDVIKQLRELIKDIWYRNHQERVRGEMELLEKALKIKKSYPQAFGSDAVVDRHLLAVAKNGLEELRNLEREGVLLSPPDHVSKRPE